MLGTLYPIGHEWQFSKPLHIIITKENSQRILIAVAAWYTVNAWVWEVTCMLGNDSGHLSPCNNFQTILSRRYPRKGMLFVWSSLCNWQRHSLAKKWYINESVKRRIVSICQIFSINECVYTSQCNIESTSNKFSFWRKTPNLFILWSTLYNLFTS